MSKPRFNTIANLKQAFIITAIGLLLAVTSFHRILDALNFSKSINRSDVQMSDVYNNVAESRLVAMVNSEIVIVALDGCNRDDIANLLINLNTLSPSVMGLDVLFFNKYEGDEYLIQAIRSCSNLILPIAIDEEEGDVIESYFYNEIPEKKLGCINLDAYASNQCVRTFRPIVQTSNFSLNAFGVQAASIADPKAYKTLLSRDRISEVISYPSVEFQTLFAKDILENPLSFKDQICGKIILMGDVENTGDFHLTPISNGMPGIMIHAHIIDTIISGKYISHIPMWSKWIIAFAVCFVFMLVKLFVRDISYKLGLLLMRVIQMSCLYLFFAIGCKMYIDHMTYIDFAPTLLMISLALFTYDIWIGTTTLIKIILKKERL